MDLPGKMSGPMENLGNQGCGSPPCLSDKRDRRYCILLYRTNLRVRSTSPASRWEQSGFANPGGCLPEAKSGLR